MLSHLGIGLNFSSRVYQTKHSTWSLKRNLHRKVNSSPRNYAWPIPKVQDAGFDVLESLESSISLQLARPSGVKGYRMCSLLAQFDVGAVRHTRLQHDSETPPTGTIPPVLISKSCTSTKTSLIDLAATKSLVLPLSAARLVSGFVVPFYVPINLLFLSSYT